MRLIQHDPRTVDHIMSNVARIVPEEVARLAPIAQTYSVHAPIRGLRWSWVFAQAIHETDWGRSEVCRTCHNWAGIKPGPHGDNTLPYRNYPTDTEGVIDHISLLAVYAGQHINGMPDPTRNERMPQIIKAHNLKHNRPALPYLWDTTHLNGLWAVPGTNYAQNIQRTWAALTL